jgi:EpsG family
LLIYFGLVTFWLLLYFIMRDSTSQDNKKRLWFALLSGAATFVVMGLRHPDVGTDTNQYLYLYNNRSLDILSLELFKFDEWGFYTLNTFINILGFENQGYILVMSLLISLSFSLFFYKYSKNIFLSFYLHLTIGLFSMSMSGLRQTLAVCLILLAFHFLIKRKLIGFFVSMLVAYTLHHSAIVFLPVFLLRNLTINKKRGIVLLILVSSTMFYRELFTPLIELVAPDRYLERYDLISDAYQVNPLLILIALAIPIVCLFFWDNLGRVENKEKEIYSILFVLSIINILLNILSLNSNMMGRLSFYFIPFIVILIPNIISEIKSKKLKIIAIYFCLILPLIQFIVSTPGGTYNIDQYKFFFQ